MLSREEVRMSSKVRENVRSKIMILDPCTVKNDTLKMQVSHIPEIKEHNAVHKLF